MVQNQIKAEEAKDQKQLNMEKYKVDTEAMVDIELKKMDMMIQSGELKITEIKTLDEMRLGMLELQKDMDKDKTEGSQKDRELDIKEEEVKIKEKALNKKPVTTNN